MSKFKAVEDIKKLARFVQGISDFAQELEKLGSLEYQELASAVTVKADQLANVQAEKLKIEDEIKILKSELSKAIVDEKEKAKDIVLQAKVKADNLLAQAKLEADQKLKEAGEIAAGLHGKSEELKSLIDSLKQEAQEKRKVVAELNSEIETIKAKLG